MMPKGRKATLSSASRSSSGMSADAGGSLSRSPILTRYDGVTDSAIVSPTASWKPSSLVSLELNGTRNVGRLREGDFTQNLVGTRLRVNVSPDLQVNSYLQYDNESDTFGTNTRLRWTFSPLGDVFVVYNHNVARDIAAADVPANSIDRRRWSFLSNELLVKVQYAFRY